MNHLPINTTLGELHGRNRIYLDAVEFAPTDARLVLVGDISSDDDCRRWIPYRLTFHGVVHHQRIDLDASGWDWTSSFEERTGSSLLRDFDRDGSKSLRHYFVQTYDDVFHVICERFDLDFARLSATHDRSDDDGGNAAQPDGVRSAAPDQGGQGEVP